MDGEWIGGGWGMDREWKGMDRGVDGEWTGSGQGIDGEMTGKGRGVDGALIINFRIFRNPRIFPIIPKSALPASQIIHIFAIDTP